jgi:hypothetical protein
LNDLVAMDFIVVRSDSNRHCVTGYGSLWLMDMGIRAL